jgi:hypothetical protein
LNVARNATGLVQFERFLAETISQPLSRPNDRKTRSNSHASRRMFPLIAIQSSFSEEKRRGLTPMDIYTWD